MLRIKPGCFWVLGGGDKRASNQESDCACALKNQAPELNEAAGCLKFLSAHSNAVFWYTLCNQTCICLLLLCFWEPNPSHTAAHAITPTSSQNKYIFPQNVSHKPIIFRSHHPREGWYEQQQQKNAFWAPSSCFSHGSVYFKVLPSYAERHLWCLRLTWRLQWTSLFSLNERSAASKAPSWLQVDPHRSVPFKPQNHLKVVMRQHPAGQVTKQVSLEYLNLDVTLLHVRCPLLQRRQGYVFK